MRPGVTGKAGAFNGLEDPVRRLPVGDLAAQIAQLAELTRVADETGVSLSMIDTLPLWQIAMVLQATQAQRLGLRGDYGIDYQLLNVARARRIQRFLSQPFYVAEKFSGAPGVFVPLHETLRGFKEILSGALDEYPEAAFFNAGTIDDVKRKAEELKKGGM